MVKILFLPIFCFSCQHLCQRCRSIYNPTPAWASKLTPAIGSYRRSEVSASQLLYFTIAAGPYRDARVGRTKKWPRYIRIHDAEFVVGKMENGVSLTKLIDTLEYNSFSSTQHNAASGEGNTNPHKAYRQQPAVELSRKGLKWLSEELQAAFHKHGKIPQYTLDELDWPELPISLSSDNNES